MARLRWPPANGCNRFAVEALPMMDSHAQFLAALADAGFAVPSVAAIREQFHPLPAALAELLLAWIPRLEKGRLRESVAWALLAAPKGTLDGAKLAELFDSANVADAASVRMTQAGKTDASSVGHEADLRYAIAAVIHQTRPKNIDQWLLAAVRDRRAGNARRHLAAALAKMVSAENAIPVLLEVFQDAPLAAVHPLGTIGDLRVRDFLIAQQPAATGPLRRELRQAIARIERRLAKSKRAVIR